MLLHHMKKHTERSDNHMTLNATLDEEISQGGPHNRVRNRKVSSSLSAKSSNSSRYNTVVKRNVGRREAYLGKLVTSHKSLRLIECHQEVLYIASVTGRVKNLTLSRER